jgi:glycerol-3-phosphate acyltransferase PlsY
MLAKCAALPITQTALLVALLSRVSTMNDLAGIAVATLGGLLLLGYFLGSIPFGIILTRMAGAGDLRSIGSGNIGATNVLRTGRKGLAAATLLFDLGKGAVAIAIAEAVAPGSGPIAGLGAFLGHLYPIWLKFNGGKGVATLLGIAIALYWPLGVVFAVAWLAVAFASRFSSLGGMVAAAAMPVAAWWFGMELALWVFIVTLGFLLWKHRGNIQRLMAGTEPKIGKSAA